MFPKEAKEILVKALEDREVVLSDKMTVIGVFLVAVEGGAEVPEGILAILIKQLKKCANSLTFKGFFF